MTGSTSKAKAGGAKSFQCKNCGGNVNLTAKGKTVVVICGSCGSTIDATDENHQILQKHKGKMESQPYIPIGTKGKLFGEKWAMIGFMVRTDKTGVYAWREYLLHNPYKGFRWLMEFDGHWNFIKKLNKPPVEAHNKALYAGQAFNLFHRGQAVVKFVLGEFYWRVAKGDKVAVADYIAPPYMLSSESDGQEITWSYCKYVEAEVVRKAFAIKELIPHQYGVAPNQPSDYEGKVSSVISHFMIFSSVLFAAFVVSNIRSPGNTIYNGRFTHNPPSSATSLTQTKPSESSFVTEPFEIKGGRNNIEYSLTAGVRNNWLSTDVVLLNLDNQNKIQFVTGVEYYRGQSWAEGSTNKVITIPDVPSGKYEMSVKTYSLNNRSYYKSVRRKLDVNPIPVAIKLRRGVVKTSNLVISLILLILPVGLIMFRKRNFEVRRWSTSDYSPYWSEDDY
jgi:hypothetical protein